ncbi:nitrilase-related carbon-nitrogen hydrolase [Campylobacter showae]|uniref:nitrilase-related carbon-nitrogen hydrolase n=1 Tax=Campylobacter showae TaxID=204 RepID=UPI000F079526|nr:nitrilase-related carbon-nitrogen hydrolase [Campylobacter showae]
MKIATVSLNQFWEDKYKNLDLCTKHIQLASSKNTDLIIFPEMTLTGFSNNIGSTAENVKNSETIKSFSILAKKFNVAIVFGMVEKNQEKALNKAVFVDKFGNILDDYSKIHPFTFANEDVFFNAGNKLCIVDFYNSKIGLTICYDLRFPELYSSLASKCDLVVNIANWPLKRVDHWNTLLKARAIENQVFVIGVNRIGLDGNGLEYVESSKIFNANGEELKSEKYENMKIYDLDIIWTKDFRLQFDTVSDRKVKFYKEIL